jgi:pyruvate/2-oxoglutarate dehydrogenase complex dihydrolipoamide acyltransferase (E2) component
MIKIVGRESIPTYLFYDIDMTWAENLRKKFAALGHKTTVTAILLKCIAIAQRAHPITRTALLPTGKLVTLNKICAGFTVERFVKGQPAVFFGSINEPDVKPITEIADELSSYATDQLDVHDQLVRQDWFNQVPWLVRQIILWLGLRLPSLRVHCLGATFGMSSLGKFGCKALIPPCVSTSTFGIGEVEERPVAVDGRVEVRPVLSLVLNFDHRVLDGGPAARFMQDVIHLLQGGLEEHVRDELDKLSSKNKSQTSPVGVGA